MSTIKADVSELKSIVIEEKRLRFALKELMAKKSKMEEKILVYLNSTEQKGVKYKDIAVISESKSRRKAKTKLEKEKDLVTVLKKNGMSISAKTVEEILNTLKGDPTEKINLKIESI